MARPIRVRNADEAIPDASSLLGALRASGYDVEAAVADIVDNSISAKANTVRLIFGDEGASSWIAIVDDGHGMDERRLVTAMTLGGINPNAPRAETDLGRFGLGLKTASFSQCKRLTVLTKPPAGTVSLRCWDIEVVNSTNRWTLLREAPNKQLAERFAAHLLKQDCGTVVLWEELDRILQDATEDEASRRLLGRIPQVEKHLGLVFHRYLSARRLNLLIGDHVVPPQDPFMEGAVARQVLGEEDLECRGHTVQVTPYVLPHVSKLNMASVGQNPKEWTERQGFYVYRNERLLVGGSWLGLGFAKEEHHKLARVRIDFPNDLDFAWDINIRKSRAVPPDELRGDLERIARKARDESRSIYRHRGAVIARDFSEKQFMWQRLAARGKVGYRLNRKHAIVEGLLAVANKSGWAPALRATLRLIEETVPVPLILTDASDNHEAVAAPVDDALGGEAEELMESCFALLRRSGLPPNVCFDRLKLTEPFLRYPEVLAALAEKHGLGN